MPAMDSAKKCDWNKPRVKNNALLNMNALNLYFYSLINSIIDSVPFLATKTITTIKKRFVHDRIKKIWLHEQIKIR